MKNYYLYLDESGSFEPQGTPNTGRASIVAGYWTEKPLSEAEAFALFQEVRASKETYASISIEPFHGMEEYRRANLGDFIEDMVRAMFDCGMKPVVFGEGRYYDIVNSDRTYLNILADGVVKLAMELLAQTEDDVQLHVLYAWRKAMSEKELSDQKKMIAQEEYKRRIEERMALGKSRISRVAQKRLQPIDIKEGSARKLHRLMLADLVCTAVRGGRQKLDAVAREYIREQKNNILVIEDDAMEQMRRLFIEDRIADAIYSWYLIYEEGSSEANRKKFHELLASNLQAMSEKGRELQYDILIQAMGTLVELKQSVQAQRLSVRLEQDLFPFLQTIDCSSDMFYFNKHFYDLTRHTHDGDTAASQREMEVCNEILSRMPLPLESAGMCIDYRIREIEHLKNTYSYEEALEKLGKLEKDLTKILAILPYVHPFAKEREDRQSDLLGKVLSSKVQVYSLLLQQGAAYSEEWEKVSDRAFEQFSQERDKRRHAQYRTALEYWRGEYEEARHFLARSVGLGETASFSEVLQKLLDGSNTFGLMHYAKWMRLAFRDGYEDAEEMFSAWEQADAASYLNERAGDHIRAEKHPGCVVCWDIAAIEAQKGKYKDAAFQAVIQSMLKDKKNLTLYFMGLAAEAERLTFVDGKHWDKDAKELSALVDLLSEEEMPETMGALAKKWKEGMASLSGLSRGEKKVILKSLAAATPTL